MELNDLILFLAIVMLIVIGLIFLKHLFKIIVLIIAALIIIWALAKFDIIKTDKNVPDPRQTHSQIKKSNSDKI